MQYRRFLDRVLRLIPPLSLAVATPAVLAQGVYPAKPIKWVMPYSVAGASD